MELNDKYWTDRYENQQASWDIGEVSTPIKGYIDQLTNRNLRILIPGCGNAYEAEYLLENGFANLTLIDISEVKASDLASRFKNHPGVKVLHADFFDHEGVYDLIIEQTFFCALEPKFRAEYVTKMHSLLAKGGKIAGVLFDKDFEGGPPFGGTKDQYLKLFSDLFHVRTMSSCYNSIPKRQDAEVFFIAEKR
jgi:SAM-dependent methyltransferase